MFIGFRLNKRCGWLVLSGTHHTFARQSGSFQQKTYGLCCCWQYEAIMGEMPSHPHIGLQSFRAHFNVSVAEQLAAIINVNTAAHNGVIAVLLFRPAFQCGIL
jgi:hypothetical protein